MNRDGISQQTGSLITRRPSTGEEWYERVQSWQHTVTSMAIVKGDRRKPNPWHYSVQTLIGQKGIYVYSYGGSIQTVQEGQLTSSPNSFDFDWTYYYDNAYNDALDRLNGKVRGQLDLATSLAESREAVKMLNMVDRYTSSVSDMKRSYNREVMRGLKNVMSKRAFAKRLAKWQSGLARRSPGLYRPIPVRKNPGVVSNASALGANGWLEFTYGWSPLISDIQGIANQVVRHTRNAMVVKARASSDIAISKAVDVSYGGFSGKFPGTASGAVSILISVKMLPNWDNNLSQWTSLNPLGVAYELLTLSFVIDWFLNVGSYMQNLETSIAFGSSFSSGFISDLRHCEWVVKGAGSSLSPWGDQYTLSSESYRKDVWFQRSIIYSYPTPLAPRFRAELGWRRLLSAASLLRQLLR